MVRIATERISDLFALAERESAQGHPSLADRYVALARRIGMRYNVRLLPEYSEVYCRGCSRFWVEGATVRTRFRGGLRVRTCLACGRIRRVAYRRRERHAAASVSRGLRGVRQPEIAWLGDASAPRAGADAPVEREAR